MTEPLWTAQNAAKATRGTATGDWHATGMSIDTRTIQPGDLFVALRGPSFDGHRFAADALSKGAAAVMIDHVPDNLPADAKTLRVTDTQAGLEALGAAGRARARAKVLAITGSVGKTGTKEALRHALSTQGKTHASSASFNNHWGVPLSLARLPQDAAYAVFELGMNHPGEIGALVRQVRPHAALITTVVAAHLGNFDSEEAIADAKAEILEGLLNGGTAVLNRDNVHFARLERAAREQQISHVATFGEAGEADVRLLSADCHANASDVHAVVHGLELHFRVALPGRHWVTNTLGVLAMVHAVDGDVRQAADSFATLTSATGRGARRHIQLAAGTFELIDDSYNANPTSMAAAFDVLGRAELGPDGRRIAALGDMLELGLHSAELHAGLAAPIEQAGIHLVFTCGAEMAALEAALPAPLCGGHAEDSEALGALVAANVRAGDVVLVKGSAGAKMGRVIRALDALDQTNGSQEGSHAS
ncbi:UDP-N-acetylmuramoylalanyl-D-glutamyl-2,6-diaminopimelate--D-alanyl-D-alanine ligase [Rhodovibrio salinarum]|uniref:UDP-N-acetylmuramoyl-tripeptide--D-alanyl-D-alanine ligase n=1 Tax=Rhodovibrio salinarum TaxID=1087 RepID=A0A934QGD8_9PROT|nr:UDP-N-acetylmuramoylalanyl-D-glutamyl-2,6-diaminopimelate--D-alanyl-D-alanine ligase [Rhodovibrio salinarum]MBK1696496.1 UDP-N-acetylmuramoylalanyl-D-glutamyl-2, 6-diaminopimelate--D-alanyl-D-alanine ligase [Rhodovibrio salinarum]